MFLRKNPRWAKMTKNGHKCPPNDIFSTVLKNFAINFCLNINLPVENPYLGKFLFWSYSWNVIRYISGWNHLISWIVCIWTNYQKRKTSNLIFLIRWPGMLRYVQRSIWAQRLSESSSFTTRLTEPPHIFSLQVITANPFV